MASQKLGSATPSEATLVTKASTREPTRVAASTPSGMPTSAGDHQRIGRDQDRVRQPLRDQVEHRRAGQQRLAEVALHARARARRRIARSAAGRSRRAGGSPRCAPSRRSRRRASTAGSPGTSCSSENTTNVAKTMIGSSCHRRRPIRSRSRDICSCHQSSCAPSSRAIAGMDARFDLCDDAQCLTPQPHLGELRRPPAGCPGSSSPSDCCTTRPPAR